MTAVKHMMKQAVKDFIDGGLNLMLLLVVVILKEVQIANVNVMDVEFTTHVAVNMINHKITVIIPLSNVHGV